MQYAATIETLTDLTDKLEKMPPFPFIRSVGFPHTPLLPPLLPPAASSSQAPMRTSERPAFWPFSRQILSVKFLHMCGPQVGQQQIWVKSFMSSGKLGEVGWQENH